MAKKNSYEYVIVGGGLSGCLMARALVQAGHTDIALIEASASIDFGQSKAHGLTSEEILFIPSGQASERAIDFIEQVTSDVIERTEIEISPVTFEKGHLEAFIGFGEKAPSEIDEVSPYLNSQRIECNPQPQIWFQKIRESLSVDILTKSEVTKIEVAEGKAVAAIINGDRRIEAKTFILCLPPTELLKIIPQASIDAKIYQKLSKSKLWTSVLLELVHKQPLTNSKAMHIFNGSSACIGQFYTSSTGTYCSQWMSFLSGEDFDEEQTASVLREMKRLIKKAYPQAFENLEFERLIVRPNSHGTIQLKLENDFSLPGIENIWLSSNLLRAEKNMIGSILQVKRVLDSIERAESAVVEKTAAGVTLL